MSPARAAFLGSAIGVGSLALHAAALGTPGPSVLAAASLGLGALATTGVLFPALEMYGRIVLRGRPGSARVALTFDDGPHPVTTRRVLEALRPTRHKATFFVLGEKARRHPDVVREIHAAGHTIGVHGDSHDHLLSFRLPRSIADAIRRAQDAVEAATGARPRFFRPPLGHTSLTTMLGARRAGVTVAAGLLEERGLIGAKRGQITVLNREGLLRAACGCYLRDRQTYEEGMGVPPSRRRY